MPITPEVNDLMFAGWWFDVFTNENGDLGFTVYDKDNVEHSVDIFVSKENGKLKLIGTVGEAN